MIWLYVIAYCELSCFRVIMPRWPISAVGATFQALFQYQLSLQLQLVLGLKLVLEAARQGKPEKLLEKKTVFIRLLSNLIFCNPAHQKISSQRRLRRRLKVLGEKVEGGGQRYFI